MRSVVTKFVTADRSPEGTAARSSQRARRRHVIDSLSTAATAAAVLAVDEGVVDRRTSQAQPSRQATSTATPAVQIPRWAVSPRAGSIRNGYASRAANEPALLSAYSQYGSAGRSSATRTALNQVLSSGVVAVIRRAGAPTSSARITRRFTTAGAAGSRSSATVAGATRSAPSARTARTPWTIAPRRAPRRVAERWA